MGTSIDEAVVAARDAYQKMALAYDAFSAAFQENVVYPELLALMQKYLGKLEGKRIMDIGCGSGRLIELLNAKGAQACGIDVTPAFVALAGARGVDVVEASLHALPYPDETFDCAVSNYAFNYLPWEGQRLGLLEQYRVLKPGGLMLFTYMHPSLMRSGRYQEETPHYPSIVEDYFSPKREEVVSVGQQTFTLYLLDWPEIVNLVLDCGFTLRELKDAECPQNIESIADAANNDFARNYILSFRRNPYAMYVVATKGGAQ